MPIQPSAEFEIRCAIIDILVFRKTQIPPHIAIDNTITTYSKGLSKKKKLQELANAMKTNHERFTTWRPQ
jgi:hypothetical protein